MFLLSLLATSICWAHKVKSGPDDTPDTQSLVTSVSVTSDSQGSIAIAGDNTPFVVKPGTAIVIDGHRATLAAVRKGMQVRSRTADDSSAPEIDLKTVQP